jgi:hypothetical protein
MLQHRIEAAIQKANSGNFEVIQITLNTIALGILRADLGEYWVYPKGSVRQQEGIPAVRALNSVGFFNGIPIHLDGKQADEFTLVLAEQRKTIR